MKNLELASRYKSLTLVQVDHLLSPLYVLSRIESLHNLLRVRKYQRPTAAGQQATAAGWERVISVLSGKPYRSWPLFKAMGRGWRRRSQKLCFRKNQWPNAGFPTRKWGALRSSSFSTAQNFRLSVLSLSSLCLKTRTCRTKGDLFLFVCEGFPQNMHGEFDHSEVGVGVSVSGCRFLCLLGFDSFIICGIPVHLRTHVRSCW